MLNIKVWTMSLGCWMAATFTIWVLGGVIAPDLPIPHRTFVKVLPEAAGVVFGGGFPREDDPACRRAAQRAISYVQRELEITGDSHNPAIVLCDRGRRWSGLLARTGRGVLVGAVVVRLSRQGVPRASDPARRATRML